MAAAAAIVAQRSVTSGGSSSGIVARRYLFYSNSFCCSSSSGYLFRTNKNDYSTLFSKSPYYHHLQLLHFFSTKTHQQQSPTTITPPLVFTEDYFVSKYGFSPQIASKLVSASARMKNPQNADLFLSFLHETGFSNAHLERIVKHHVQLLSTSPQKSVKPKLKIFHDLGFSADEATQLIARDLTILSCQPKRIICSLSVFHRLLGSIDHVVEFIKKHNSMLYADPEKTISPNIQFLNQCGVQMDQINSLICTIPHLFTLSPENLKRCVDKVDEMGVERTSRMFIYAVYTVSAMSDETLKLKLKSFRDLGFSEDDIFRMFRTAPQVIAVSTQKIKEVIEVLLESGKYDMLCIIKNPTSLARSVENRYKPRLQVLKELEKKGLITKWPSLSVLGTMSHKRFFEKFVAPYINEVGEDFIAKTSLS